jgi:hypothetical protein
MNMSCDVLKHIPYLVWKVLAYSHFAKIAFAPIRIR